MTIKGKLQKWRDTGKAKAAAKLVAAAALGALVPAGVLNPAVAEGLLVLFGL